ncbi:MAG: hypothetical protein H6985_18860 [Pseudomonadales bacterium]|nr:hypothetical protein [Pseudomonadales bacterium]
MPEPSPTTPAPGPGAAPDNTPRLGPVALCTLLARDGQALVDAYTGYLHQVMVLADTLDAITAGAIGYPELSGARCWLLANARGRRWLQVVEYAAAIPGDSLASYGWLAMEVLVADVDSLAAGLNGSPFEILRPPANLDVSDRIRACQVKGPAGELLYLTQVDSEVPPFELPVCEAPVDHLFIPVLSTPSRERSLAEYSALSGTDGLSFDTRVTVVNQARGFDLERRHPVATLQLRGQALIEIDEIAGTRPPSPGICSGMASVAFYCDNQRNPASIAATTGPFANQNVVAGRGCAGERFTLVYP